LQEILLKAEVHSQTLTLKTVSNIAEKSQNYLQMEFNFDDTWNSEDITSKICVFSKNDEKYEVIIDDNICLVPWEVLQTKGYVKVSCYALADENTIITTNSEKFYVETTATGELVETNEATPTVYTQILEQIKNSNISVDEIKEDINNYNLKIIELQNTISGINNYDDSEIKELINNNTLKITELESSVESNTSIINDINTKTNSIAIESIKIYGGSSDESYSATTIKDEVIQLNGSKFIALFSGESYYSFQKGDILTSTGKKLTDNNFTNEYKEKLDGLTSYDDSNIKEDINNNSLKITELENTVNNLTNYDDSEIKKSITKNSEDIEKNTNAILTKLTAPTTTGEAGQFLVMGDDGELTWFTIQNASEVKY
jgi:Fe-S-cluster formation regulator IscX/YfhJ